MSLMVSDNSLYLKNPETNEFLPVSIFNSGADKSMEKIAEFAEATKSEAETAMTVKKTEISEGFREQLESQVNGVISEAKVSAEAAIEAKKNEVLGEIPNSYTELQDSVNQVKDDLADLTDVNAMQYPILWQTGGFDNSGIETSSTSYQRTDYISTEDLRDVSFQTNGQYSVWLYYYSADKVWQSPYATKTGNFTVSDDYPYVRMLVLSAKNAVTASKPAEIHNHLVYSATESNGTVALKDKNGNQIVSFSVGSTAPLPEPLKDYWVQPFNDAVAHARNMRSNGYSNYVVITDLHYSDNKRYSPTLLNRLYETGYFDGIMVLGDIVDKGTTSDVNYQNLISDGLNKHSDNILLVLGNHDNYLDKGIVFDDFMKSKDIVFSDSNNDYSWYFDDCKTKIRYIGIDRKGTYYPLAFISKAILNVPTGYSYCIVMHYTLQANPQWTLCWEAAMENALLKLVTMSDKPFVGFITGHQHLDETTKMSNGAYHSTLFCDRFENARYYDYDYPEKIENTDTDQVLTIFSVNPVRNAVQFYRVGSCCNSDHKKWGYKYSSISGANAKIVSFDVIPDVYIKSNGQQADYTRWGATDFIDIGEAHEVIVATNRAQEHFNMQYQWFYTADKSPIQNIGIRLEATGSFNILTVPENAKYVRFSNFTDSVENNLIVMVT